MKPEIQLNSRYGIDNRLIRVGEEDSVRYTLQTPYNYRVGFDKDPTHPTFVDPSGGPFIAIGSEIEGHIVKEIVSLEEEPLTIVFEK